MFWKEESLGCEGDGASGWCANTLCWGKGFCGTVSWGGGKGCGLALSLMDDWCSFEHHSLLAIWVPWDEGNGVYNIHIHNIPCKGNYSKDDFFLDLVGCWYFPITVVYWQGWESYLVDLIEGGFPLSSCYYSSLYLDYVNWEYLYVQLLKCPILLHRRGLKKITTSMGMWAS